MFNYKELGSTRSSRGHARRFQSAKLRADHFVFVRRRPAALLLS